MTLLICTPQVLLADSQVICAGIVTGAYCKVFLVPQEFGGGAIAFAGDYSAGRAAVESFIQSGQTPSGGNFSLVHLHADGTIWWADNGYSFTESVAPYHVEGSAVPFASGCMAVTSDPILAARITAKYNFIGRTFDVYKRNERHIVTHT